jgi:hypothetical protein
MWYGQNAGRENKKIYQSSQAYTEPDHRTRLVGFKKGITLERVCVRVLTEHQDEESVQRHNPEHMLLEDETMQNVTSLLSCATA